MKTDLKRRARGRYGQRIAKLDYRSNIIRENIIFRPAERAATGLWHSVPLSEARCTFLLLSREDS